MEMRLEMRGHFPYGSGRWIQARWAVGWGLGLQASRKPQRQVQGQTVSVGKVPVLGFPETGHSSWERFPGPAQPHLARGTLGDGWGWQAGIQEAPCSA